MIDVEQFRDNIVWPTLRHLGDRYASPAAVELLLGTALQESRLQYLRQLGGGPALGVYQMEPATHEDIWENYLLKRPEFAARVLSFTKRPSEATELIGNLWYATAMTRVHYWRVPAPLPQKGDVAGMAAYWKEHYNTYLGAGTEEEYIENWEAYGVAVQG